MCQAQAVATAIPRQVRAIDLQDESRRRKMTMERYSSLLASETVGESAKLSVECVKSLLVISELYLRILEAVSCK